MQECEGQETEECKLARRDAHDSAKEYLLNSIERAKGHLEQLQAKIASSEGMSEEEVLEMTDEINEGLNGLSGLAEDVDEAETKEDIKDAAAELETIWKKQKQKAEKYAGRVIHAKVGEIVVQAQQLETKMERVLARLEAKGVDTSGFDAEAFSGYVEAARSKFEEARTLFAEGEVSQAKMAVREAHQSLKQAHNALRDVVRRINAAGGDLEAEEEIEEAPEEEVSEEEAAEELEEDEEEMEDDEEEVEVEEESEDEEEAADEEQQE